MALSKRDASIVMGMLARGDYNHDIAAWFGENPGRIAEVKDGTMFGVVPAASPTDLPPKGPPGLKGRRLRAYAEDALKILRAKGSSGLDEAVTELSNGIRRFDENEAS